MGTSPTLALLLLLAPSAMSEGGAGARELEGAVPKVALLPLQPEGVKRETAVGMSALFREALARAEEGADGQPLLELLPEDLKDRKRARRCKLDQRCLAQLRKGRAAGMLAGGVVRPADDLFEIELLVIGEGSRARTVTETIGGDEGGLELGFDRLARRAFAPQALAGSLLVEGGPEGAEILVDGKRAGTLPLDGPIDGLVEGPHTVVARKEGYEALERPVRIRFRETATVKMVLVRGEVARSAGGGEAEGLSAIHLWGPAGVGAAAAALFVGGLGVGTFTLVQALEVQRRAERQQLIFPRDEFLLRSGQGMAVAANVLYGAAFVLALGAAGWLGGAFAWDLLSAEEADPLGAPPPGAPSGQPRRERKRDAPAPAFEAPSEDEGSGDEDTDAEGAGAPLPEGDGS